MEEMGRGQMRSPHGVKLEEEIGWEKGVNLEKELALWS